MKVHISQKENHTLVKFVHDFSEYLWKAFFFLLILTPRSQFTLGKISKNRLVFYMLPILLENGPYVIPKPKNNKSMNILGCPFEKIEFL